MPPRHFALYGSTNISRRLSMLMPRLSLRSCYYVTVLPLLRYDVADYAMST